jgi:hypothetical protein
MTANKSFSEALFGEFISMTSCSTCRLKTLANGETECNERKNGFLFGGKYVKAVFEKQKENESALLVVGVDDDLDFLKK